MNPTLTSLVEAIAAQVRASGNSLTRSHVAALLALVGPHGQEQDTKKEALAALLTNLGIQDQTANGSVLDTIDSYGEY